MDKYSQRQKQELLGLARHTIVSFIERGVREFPTNSDPAFEAKRGVFVTLHMQGELRGCIGYPLPIKPLIQAVMDNAISAATEDPRFPSVTLEEMALIDIEISILTVPVEVGGVEDVEVGRDGIIISKGHNRGLLLPQVPVEQRWDRTEYISYGCMKAGLPQNEWKKGVKIETFQAIVFGEKDR